MREPPYAVCAWAGAALLGFAESARTDDAPAAGQFVDHWKKIR